VSVTFLRNWTYSIFFNGYDELNFGGSDFTLKIENEYVESIHLEAIPSNETVDTCELKVTFHFKDIEEKLTLPDIKEKNEELLNLLCDYLSFEFGLSIKRIERPGSKFLAKMGAIKHFNEEHKIKMEREISNIKFEPYKRLYRSAMSNDDNVAKFMFLYSILFDVLKVRIQEDVDCFIRNECLEVYKYFEDRPSEKKNKHGESVRDETIYTWLRNQVGHTQSESQISSVTGHIDVKVRELASIVAKAINMYAS